MKKPLFKRVLTGLLAVMVSFSGISFRAVFADSTSTWKKVDGIAEAVASGKQVAITMTTSSGTVYALPNATSTNTGPTGKVVTKDANGNLELDADQYGWTITAEEGGYTITHGQYYLYVTATNNGVRVNIRTINNFKTKFRY